MTELIYDTIPENIELTIKIIILFILLLFFLYLKWYAKKIQYEQGTYNYLLFIFCNYMSMVYIFISPFSFLLLYHNITFEAFVLFLVSIYLIFGLPGLILLGLFAKDKILSYVSKDKKMQRREKQKYGN
jgi:hypothetical protein